MREKALVEEILKEAFPRQHDVKVIYKLVSIVVVAGAVVSFGVRLALSPIDIDDQRLVRALASDISRMDGTSVADELDRAASVAGRATYRDIRVVELSDVMVYLQGRVAASERHLGRAVLDADALPTRDQMR